MRATPPPERPTEIRPVGAWSVSVLAPVITGAKAGPVSFTWLGVSFVSYTGQMWFLPQPGRSGFTARAGGRLAMAEAMPLGVYASELAGGSGYRWNLGGAHPFALVGAVEGSGGLAMQHQFALLRFPEAEAAWQHHSRTHLVSIGGLAGLSMVGRYAIGKKLVVGAEEQHEKDALSSTHYFKPYLGARADLVVNHLMLSMAARRTYLGDAEPGGPLDHLLGHLCYARRSDFKAAPWGGCLVGELYRGELERIAPVEGPVRDAWSYRIGLNLMLAQVLLK